MTNLISAKLAGNLRFAAFGLLVVFHSDGLYPGLDRFTDRGKRGSIL